MCRFKDVGPRVADAVLVTFDKDEAEGRIRLGADGKVNAPELVHTKG